jgi:hypothetical protein
VLSVTAAPVLPHDWGAQWSRALTELPTSARALSLPRCRCVSKWTEQAPAGLIFVTDNVCIGLKETYEPSGGLRVLT